MDTPERNKIGSTPVSKFEDSPVFNYINSLSPIKPVKSTHITQAFNPLNFAALPSVFTSPHVSSHKESRFLRRHNHYSDPSEPQVPSADENKDFISEGGALNISQLYNNSTGPEENFDSGVSRSNLSIDPLNNHPKSIEELQRLNRYTAIPNSDPMNPGVIQVDGLSEFAGTSDLILSNGKKHHENGSSESVREGMGYDWEGLIADGADLLIFASPNGSDAIRLVQKPLGPLTDFSPSSVGVQNDNNNMQMIPIVNPVDSCGHREAEEPSSDHAETQDLDEHRKLDVVNYSNSEKCMTHCSGENLDNEVASDCPIFREPISTLHRGLRRRCLDFETVGTHKKNLGEGSSCSSKISDADENLASDNKQLLRCKSAGSSSMYVLNGIGLHLNALAASSNGYKDVNHKQLSYRRQLSLPSTTALYPSPTTEEESLLASAVSEKDADPSENAVQMDEDASHASPYVLGEDFNQNSPKKKRRREYSGESESCKRCNCKKSKCLKLYCECFAAGVYCIEPCSCQECFNKPIHEDTVLATRKQIESRNPLAFAPKVIRNSETMPELGDESSKTPASARHKRGCNCKKSSCLKKYCECYQGGVGCSISCRCEGCKNAFGRKDGSDLMELETEQDEDETEASLKSVAKKPSPLGTEIQHNEEQNSGPLLPTTPLQVCRPMVPLPFSSRTKLGSSFLITGSSSGLYTSQKLEKPNILGPQLKFDKNMKAVLEDELPEILQIDSPPRIKTTSPNSKRVSPPKSDFGSSPFPRTGRKLILQSIPSFPSLTPQH